MSSLVVEVCEVVEVRPHPNADKLDVIRIKGWEVVTGKGNYVVGQCCVYFPPDAIVPPDISDKHGVTKYLGHLPKNEDGTRPPGGRVMVANLRGFKSYGYTAEPDDPTWEIGKDVAEYYRVTKYEPPLRANQGNAERPHYGFHRYYDMENIRNFLDVFQEGEEVVCTEKIHGENCRLALIRDTNEKGEAVWKWMAGSHDVRRKQFWQKKDQETGEPFGPVLTSASWQCFNEDIRKLLCFISNCGYMPEEIDNEPVVKNNDGHNVVLFGERFGCVQDMWYGHSNGKFSFRAFDITKDGKYLDFDLKKAIFDGVGSNGIEMVPIVWRGPYSFAKIEELSEGPTLVCDPKAGKNFREGVVVLAVKERQVVTQTKVMDRAQLKCVSFTYLNRKEGTEFH